MHTDNNSTARVCVWTNGSYNASESILYRHKDAFYVVPDAQYVVECAWILVTEPYHVRPDVMSIGDGI